VLPPSAHHQRSGGTCCSSILPYRYYQSSAPAPAAAAPSTADKASAERDRQAEAKTDKAYDLTIGAASLLGGFTMKDVLGAPSVTDFSQDWALYVYRVLLPATAALDMFAVVTLVLNRYLAARAYKDADEQAYSEFVRATAFHRRRAVWAFLSSLPLFLVAAAAKQFHGLEARLALAGPVPVLLSACGLILFFALLQASSTTSSFTSTSTSTSS
jgi:hypothetical protein